MQAGLGGQRGVLGVGEVGEGCQGSIRLIKSQFEVCHGQPGFIAVKCRRIAQDRGKGGDGIGETPQTGEGQTFPERSLRVAAHKRLAEQLERIRRFPIAQPRLGEADGHLGLCIRAQIPAGQALIEMQGRDFPQAGGERLLAATQPIAGVLPREGGWHGDQHERENGPEVHLAREVWRCRPPMASPDA